MTYKKNVDAADSNHAENEKTQHLLLDLYNRIEPLVSDREKFKAIREDKSQALKCYSATTNVRTAEFLL